MTICDLLKWVVVCLELAAAMLVVDPAVSTYLRSLIQQL